MNFLVAALRIKIAGEAAFQQVEIKLPIGH
jgi:hypothetical protein